MIIVWRGWGFLVLPIVFACVVVAGMMGSGLQGLGLMANWAQAIGALIATIVGSAGIWFVARMITNSRPPRRLVDQQTGQEIIVRADAGSLFFIPTRFWALIVLCLGIILSAALAAGHNLLDEAATDSAPAQK